MEDHIRLKDPQRHKAKLLDLLEIEDKEKSYQKQKMIKTP